MVPLSRHRRNPETSLWGRLGDQLVVGALVGVFVVTEALERWCSETAGVGELAVLLPSNATTDARFVGH
jgi:hypothetical protein